MEETDPDQSLQRAGDPATDEDDLGKLAFHDDARVRQAVLGNPSTPAWARSRLQREMAPSAPMALAPLGGQPSSGSGRLYALNPFVSTLDFIPGHTVVAVKGTIYSSTSTMGTKAKTDDGSWINRLEGRLEHATRESLQKLWQRAQQEGANAVIGVRIAAADSEGSGVMAARSSGVVLLGTAVIVQPTPSEH